MFKRAIKVGILVLSLLTVFGISALWMYQLVIDSYVAGYEVAHTITEFTANGSFIWQYSLGCNGGGFYIAREYYTFPLWNHVWIRKSHDSDWVWRPIYFRDEYPSPRWSYCGFNFQALNLGTGRKLAVVVPDWFIICLGLLAIFAMFRKSETLRRRRAALAGRCDQCGSKLSGADCTCPQCGVAPWRRPTRATTWRHGRWLFWWIPACSLGICAAAAALVDDTGDWPVIFIGFALVCMILFAGSQEPARIRLHRDNAARVFGHHKGPAGC